MKRTPIVSWGTKLVSGEIFSLLQNATCNWLYTDWLEALSFSPEPSLLDQMPYSSQTEIRRKTRPTAIPALAGPQRPLVSRQLHQMHISDNCGLPVLLSVAHLLLISLRVDRMSKIILATPLLWVVVLYSPLLGPKSSR